MKFLNTKVFECLSTREKSRNLLDILPQIVTLDPNYAGLRGTEFTLFREIRLVPFEELITEEMRKLFTTRIDTTKMRKSQFFVSLQQKYEEIIEANWKPELNHIHLHSSGLDSRIISWTIRSLFRKHGSDWLGRTVFVCSKQEGPSFKKIMEYEGWKRNQYLVVGEGLRDEDVWTPIFLDFKNAWRRAYDTFTHALNIHIYLPEMAHQKLGFPLNNIQLWDGDGGGLVSQISGLAMKKWFKLHYPFPCGGVPKEWQLIRPHLDFGSLKFILQSSVSLGKQLRPELLTAMNKGLAQFPNLNKQGHEIPKIADWVLKKALEDYRKSWYGQTVRPNAIWPLRMKKHLGWQPMLSYWTIASLCDYLLTSGYEITV